MSRFWFAPPFSSICSCSFYRIKTKFSEPDPLCISVISSSMLLFAVLAQFSLLNQYLVVLYCRFWFCVAQGQLLPKPACKLSFLRPERYPLPSSHLKKTDFFTPKHNLNLPELPAVCTSYISFFNSIFSISPNLIFIE